jgi:hypothetical protein
MVYMNQIYDLKVTVNTRPAYALMVKYRLQRDLKKLGQNIIIGMAPHIEKMDKIFTEH